MTTMTTDMEGVVRRRFSAPVTALEAWRRVIGATYAQLGKWLGVSDSQAYVLSQSGRGSQATLNRVVDVTGLPAGAVLAAERRREWVIVMGAEADISGLLEVNGEQDCAVGCADRQGSGGSIPVCS